MSKIPFQKVLVANRGEIAVRLIRGLRDMGLHAVAIASDPDQSAEHVRAANEVIFMPGATSTETYLQGAHIIELALAHGVQAIHPGYGFLSENADFAEACQKAGLIFIGPSADVIREMGDKIRAKARMIAAGVPVVPGWVGDANTAWREIAQAAESVGYPILVKAAAGGGGKGMRLVSDAAELEAAWSAAAREAQSAFGDARVFLEKYLSRPRHVEFQIFGDSHGNVLQLFERECSIQRRHQKLIEETPSPALSSELRSKMAEAALKAARAMGYTNAGTIEFILDEAGNFYFLEVNTRLQVEHPITELTIGQDLLRWQIMVAAGLPLPLTQAQIMPRGHAIECRICAEDPTQNFMPATGTLSVYRPPEGPFIRVDSGVREGSEVSVYYDPLLAKLIVWAPDRDSAMDRMSRALATFAIIGVANNTAFLREVIDHPDFRAGRIHTHFLSEHPSLGQPEISLVAANREVIALALAASAMSTATASASKSSFSGAAEKPLSPWGTNDDWRNVKAEKSKA
jgi:acetyl-CoA carboxylase biotin carboxylase subunit